MQEVMLIMPKTSCNNKKENVTQHYESQWENYSEEDVLKRVKNLAAVIDTIISQLAVEPGVKILDLGSGPGITPLRLMQTVGDNSGAKIYGIDTSEKALQIGNKVIAQNSLNDSIHLVLGDAENLPFQNRSFDAVVSNATLNLLPDKESGFYEIARVTKDGGCVVIADCTVGEGKKCSQESQSVDLWSACVAGAPTNKEILELAEQAGLDLLQSIELTNEVSYLVKNKLWDWPEFIEHGLEYHVFGMRKRG